MHNIMKALNYQIRNDNFLYYIILFSLILPVGLFLLDMGVEMNDLNGGLYLVFMGETYVMCVVMVLVLLIPRICGWDAKDGTMNYEILIGHTRAQVYFGRVILSILWGFGCVMVMVLLPLAVMTGFKGWGINVNLGDMIFRYIILLFPLFRFVSELVLLTFLFHNYYAATILGWVLFVTSVLIQMIYQEITNCAFNVLLFSVDMQRLIVIDNYKIIYQDGVDLPIYQTALSLKEAGESMGVSLVVGIFCLLCGYICFKKRDI